MLRIVAKPNAILSELVGICVVTDRRYDDTLLLSDTQTNRTVFSELFISEEHPWANGTVSKSLEIVNEYFATMSEFEEQQFVQLTCDIVNILLYSMGAEDINIRDMMESIGDAKSYYEKQTGMYDKLCRFIKSKKYPYEPDVHNTSSFKRTDVVVLTAFILHTKLFLPVLHILNNLCRMTSQPNNTIVLLSCRFYTNFFYKHGAATQDKMIDYIKGVCDTKKETDVVYEVMCTLIAIHFPTISIDTFATNAGTILRTLIKLQANKLSMRA